MSTMSPTTIGNQEADQSLSTDTEAQREPSDQSSSHHADDAEKQLRRQAQEPVSGKDIVNFDSLDDTMNPINWPFHKKVITTMLYGLTTGGATWASSIYSVATSPISSEFRLGEIVSTLGLTLYLLELDSSDFIHSTLSTPFLPHPSDSASGPSSGRPSPNPTGANPPSSRPTSLVPASPSAPPARNRSRPYSSHVSSPVCLPLRPLRTQAA